MSQFAPKQDETRAGPCLGHGRSNRDINEKTGKRHRTDSFLFGFNVTSFWRPNGFVPFSIYSIR
jgi:hypothetical protein